MSCLDPLRILILSPSLPYPPSWGFGIRVYQIIRYLAQRHRVSVLTYGGPGDRERVVALEQTGARVYAVPGGEATGATKRRAQLASLISPWSFQRQLFYSRAMQVALNELTRAEAFDVIQLESSQLCSFDFRSRARLVIDEHNIEYELLHRTYKTERSPLRKLYSWVEYQKFRREEQRSWRKADGCVLTSDREELMLRQHTPGTPTRVVPNGVDVEHFRDDGGPRDLDSIVFVGVMHYRPNVDAAMYFARDVLPHILRQRPNAVFTIVGGGAPEELRRLAGPHVVLTDTVPDTRPYVQRAGAVVVPLRMGSGTRLKVLEGLAMGKPLVSTTLGCEGIAARSDEHLLVADTAEAFAQHVVRILNDPNLAARLGRSGRQLAEERYSWSSVLQSLEQFLVDSAGREPADAPRYARWQHQAIVR